MATRVVGAGIATGGLALMGLGTVGSPVTSLNAVPLVITDQGCNASTQVCLHEAHEGLTAAQAQSTLGVDCDFTSADTTKDGWLFVLPNEGKDGVFVPGTFSAWFDGSSIAGTVPVPGVGNGDHKFAVVYAPAGSTLQEATANAVVEGTSTPLTNDDIFGTHADTLGFNVTGVCPATTTSTTSSTTNSSTSFSTTSQSTTSQSTTSQSTTSQSTTSAGGTTSSSSSSKTSTNPSSSASSTATAGVKGASTSTPSTGAGSDAEFGLGLGLLIGGAALLFGSGRLMRRTKK